MRWEPASGDGFVVVVQLDHARREPCEGLDPSPGRGREQVDGVWRPTAFSFAHCVDEGPHHIRCAAWHTRGYLEPGEVDAARAVCASFRVLGVSETR